VRGPATTPPRAPAGVSLLAALFFAAVTVLMTWPHAAQAATLAFVATVAASLYPAWKASRLPIVDALRHNR